MEWLPDLTNPEIWLGFLTLTVLEIVLGIDNIVFISILSDKLPEKQQPNARRVGLLLAMLMRIALLFCIAWLIGLTEPLFDVFSHEVSGRDLIFLAGGLFLLAKSVHEIHQKLEGEEGHSSSKVTASFAGVITQIVLLDVVFSIDSVITAVGMVDEIAIMVAAVVIAVGIMLLAAEAISSFVNEHPTVKILALSFLLLIGTTLVAEAMHFHIPKGYIYFSMGFAVLVEMLNLRMRSKREPVQLHESYTREEPKEAQEAKKGTQEEAAPVNAPCS